ncbi:MAG: heavy-metal-associated domain-containing protein [Flavobacteriales bacterium]|nr:heavy-metal-associated domain-containing protein [Flavobacteriales bacterium]
MKTVKYKTNINCTGCLKSVTPLLNELDNINTWKVNLENVNKILEVDLDDDNDSAVVDAVKEAGFQIEEIQ